MRLWDAQTGQPIGAPLTGHTGCVEQRRVQPRRPPPRLRRLGQHGAALGRRDRAADWHSPSAGHTGSVDQRRVQPRRPPRSSPASADQTVRVWDAADRAADWRPTSAGTRLASSSVAFSPDGRRLVSGQPGPDRAAVGRRARASRLAAPLSGPHMVRLERRVQPRRPPPRLRQRGRDGAAVGRGARGSRLGSPLQGTQAACLSVAFSPDGRRVVTGGCGQHGAGVGRARRGSRLGSPLQGHTATR